MPQQYYRQFPDQSSPLAYELPDQRYLATPGAPPQAAPPNPLLPNQGDGSPLAEVEGLTDAYYNTFGKLRSFAQSMWKDKGIDVTAPDIDQPGGGTPFKTYQLLEAQLMRTANHLSNRQKETVQMRPYEATGQVVQRDGQYETQALRPEVEDALKKIDGPFYNKAEADRAKERIVGPLLAKLEEEWASGHQDPMLAHNIQTLRGAGTTYSTYPGLYTFQPREDATDKARLKAAAGATREVGVLKRFTALKNGFWEPGSYQVRKDAATGNPELENRSHEGETFGATVINNSAGVPQNIKRIVDAWVRKPDKSVWVTFKPDPEAGTTPPPVRVDNQDGADVTAVFQQGNPKFGQSPQMYQAVDILGYSDPNNTGGLHEPTMYNQEDPNGLSQLEAGRNSIDTELGGYVKQEAEKKSLADELGKLSGTWLAGGKEFVLPNGQKVNIKKHFNNDTYYIPGDKEAENLTLDDLYKLLSASGYFSNQGTVQPPLDKATELINKYRK